MDVTNIGRRHKPSYSTSKLLASCQIREIAGCAFAGNAGWAAPRVSDSDMHQGTCGTHVPWCMPGWRARGFLWIWWRGKHSRHSRCMRNPQFYVSGKRPKANDVRHSSWTRAISWYWTWLKRHYLVISFRWNIVTYSEWKNMKIWILYNKITFLTAQGICHVVDKCLSNSKSQSIDILNIFQRVRISISDNRLGK